MLSKIELNERLYHWYSTHDKNNNHKNDENKATKRNTHIGDDVFGASSDDGPAQCDLLAVDYDNIDLDMDDTRCSGSNDQSERKQVQSTVVEWDMGLSGISLSTLP